jgi:hypothetical protein
MNKTIDRGKLTLMLGVSASILAGCGRSDAGWQVCSDSLGRRAPDDQCAPSGGYYGGAHWLYLRGGGAPPIGQPITGGFSAPDSGRYGRAPAGGIVRGGFGGFFRGLFQGFKHIGFGG